jgi:hypothetical protein
LDIKQKYPYFHVGGNTLSRWCNWSANNSFFLLSMNEVSIKYWFRNFQKKKFFIENFINELGLFIEEKPIFMKNKCPPLHSAVCPEKFGSPLLPFSFNLETSPFDLVNDLVLNRSYWFLDFENKFRRVATIQIFGSFFALTRNIHQFECFWAWNIIKLNFSRFKKNKFSKIKKKTKKKLGFQNRTHNLLFQLESCYRSANQAF